MNEIDHLGERVIKVGLMNHFRVIKKPPDDLKSFVKNIWAIVSYN
jgi:hypothetical protein